MTSWVRLAWLSRSPVPRLRTQNLGIIPINLRRYNWVNPRIRQAKKHKKPTIIIEDSPEQSQNAHLISDFKHYLKTTEIPSKLRIGILKTKLSSVANEVTDYSINKDMIPIINAVFMHLYRVHKGDLSEIIQREEIYMLYKKTAQSLPQSGSFELPEFMVRLTQDFLLPNQSTPDDILVQIIALGSSLKFSEFKSILEFIVKKKRSLLSQTFTKAALDYLGDKKELNLATFEAFLDVATSQKAPYLLNNDYCNGFIQYTESLFEERNPRVHEYQELDKNIYRIQYVTTRISDQSFGGLDLESAMKLFKLKADLNSVKCSDQDHFQIQKMLTKLNDLGKSSDFAEMKDVVFRQNFSDESLAETLLVELIGQRELFVNMRTSLSEYLVSDDVKFSADLRMKAELSQTLDKVRGEPESVVYNEIEPVFTPYVDLTGDISLTHASIVQALMLSGCVTPSGEGLLSLNKTFERELSLDQTIPVFKFRIDRAIELEDHVSAYQIFEESLKAGAVNWEETSDPRNSLTLNNLIGLICEKENDIVEIFPKFRKIKQHMSTNASAEAITLLAKRMLAGECVGDTIELLKRELPKTDKEATIKLQVSPPWAYAYKELFEILHNFVITYENESTHETNWVLYGELHKYFHVPYETYLPAIQYFCKADRLNAALVIFRQIKRLNELHGSNNRNPPPLREMYMYLLRTFGDRLYEEGVLEMHEYMSMDVHLQDQDIDLQNSLLNAYSNLQSIGKARDLFLSISSNPKQHGGINEETVQIMIKTYTYSDILYVKKFWNNLSQFGIFPDYGIYKQYLIAHVYHGLTEDAFKLIDEIDDYNIELSPDLLVSMFNYCLDSKKQKEIETWAIENHKEMWDDIKTSGVLKTATDYMPDTNLLTDGSNA